MRMRRSVKFTAPLAVISVTAWLVVGPTPSANAERPPAEDLVLDSFAAMEEFARCVPRFEIASAIAANAEKPATAEEYSGASRGALSVSMFFAMVLAAEATRPSEEPPSTDYYSEGLKYRSNQVESFIEIERVAQHAKLEMGEIDWDGLKYCHDLQPLQIRVIEGLRRDGLL